MTGRRREIYRSPVGERQVTAGFIAVLQRSTGLPAVTAGSPDDHQRDIGRKFGHLRIKSALGRTVSEQRSSGDHWVSLRLCSRSRKSAGYQRISKNSNLPNIRRPRLASIKFNWEVPLSNYGAKIKDNSILYDKVSLVH